MNKFYEVLKALRKAKGLTQKDLATHLKISRSTIGMYENGAREPDFETLELIADYFNVDIDYLLGRTSKTTYIPCENTNNPSSGVSIPVLGSIPAGVPIEAIEDIIDWEEIPKQWTAGGREYFALKVKGDSMYPKYLEGDTIIVRKENDCESGQDCVVYVNGYDATLKKVIKNVDHIILQPLNSNYEPKMFEYNDEKNPIRIAGVVVEIRRKV